MVTDWATRERKNHAFLAATQRLSSSVSTILKCSLTDGNLDHHPPLHLIQFFTHFFRHAFTTTQFTCTNSSHLCKPM